MTRGKDIMVRLPIEVAEAIEKDAKSEGLTLATKVRSMIIQYKNLKDDRDMADNLIIGMRNDFDNMNKRYDEVFQKIESLDNSIKDLTKIMQMLAETLTNNKHNKE